MTFYATQTVGNIAARNPASIRVFEAFGIDYCCGGKLSLEAACAQANAPLEKVLAAVEEDAAVQPEQQWTDRPASELIAHIIQTHHAFVRREIPRLERLLMKVGERHGARHEELARIQELFAAAAQELQAHLLREEQVLFPYVDLLENAVRLQASPPAGCFGSVEFPIARMIADHDDAGELFASMRRLSNTYTPPGDACMSFTAVYKGLEEFELDLHRHIHLENNILFPRAIELERSLRAKNHVDHNATSPQS